MSSQNPYHLNLIIRSIWSDAEEKFQTRSCERIGAVEKCSGFGRSFGCIGVFPSQRLAFIRTKELDSPFHNLLCSNEAIHEATIE